MANIPNMTENDRFRQADTCVSIVDKTVETVNNILHMHGKPKYH